MTAARADRLLAWLLRGVGGLLVCAVFAVPIPDRTMGRIHQDTLGMGTFPEAPIVGYLTRTASLLYAMHGAIMIYVSCNIPRYRPIIYLLAILNGIFGLSCIAVDLAVGMPNWWMWLEGPVISIVAILTIVLARRGRTCAWPLPSTFST